ncbi:MAG: MerR family transcriptional regulator [Bacteroidales bacterium]|nr:MerR family transcriptional regulator [Bacteroidales bacterium]
MTPTLNIQQLAEATDLSRTQIDQWISRGHFKPKNPAEIGKARAFTIEDAVVLGALAELVRIGLTPTVASMHVHSVYAVIDDDALLVVSQGPDELASGDRRALYYDPAHPATHGRIVRARDLAGIATDPKVRSMAVVNLSDVEKRVLKVAGAS